MKITKLILSLILVTIITTTGTALDVNEEAPTFSITTLDGKAFNLIDYRGKKKVHLVFWATWCPACTDKVPELKKMYNNKTSNDVKFLAINVGSNDSLKKVNKYIKKHKIKYAAAFDKGSKISTAYEIYGIPSQFVIDKKGNIQYKGYKTPVINNKKKKTN
jgi:peroxiredoxin